MIWLALAIALVVTFPAGRLTATSTIPADAVAAESSSATPAAQPQSGDAKRHVVVRFPPSRSTVTLPGQVTGYDVIDYVVSARAGQQLTVRFITPGRFLTMAVYGPDEQEICVEKCGDRWTGAISRAGDYIVRVGLARAEARRNRPARFQLRVTVTSSSK